MQLTSKIYFPDPTRSLSRSLSQAGQTLRFWNERARQRRQLAELTPEQLWDMGITRDEIRAESKKAFWQD